MPTGPPDQSPPVEADFGLSHDAITAELLDPTWQFLTHASPTVRAELGQFVALPTVSTPSPASAAYSSAPHGTTHATHTASEHHKDQQVGPKLAPTTRVHTAQVGPHSFPPGARSRSRNQRVEPTGVSGIATLFRKKAYLRLTVVGGAARAS
jgi:hypothetical protein